MSRTVKPIAKSDDKKIRIALEKKNREVSSLKNRVALLQLKLKSLQSRQETPLEQFEESVVVDLSRDFALYEKVIAAYRQQNLSEVSRASQFLVKAYPESTKADDALFVGARLAFELGRFSDSITFINELTRRYPQSNRLSAILLLQGLANQRDQQLGAAKLKYDELDLKFPGSPEARNAAIQRRMAGIPFSEKTKEGEAL